jgi:epsilon-lactone hydrolase
MRVAAADGRPEFLWAIIRVGSIDWINERSAQSSAPQPSARTMRPAAADPSGADRRERRAGNDDVARPHVVRSSGPAQRVEEQLAPASLPGPGGQMTRTEGIAAQTGESTSQRLLAGVLRGLLRATLQPAFRAGQPIERQRRRLARVTQLTLAPRGVRFVATACGGVPGESVTANDCASPRRAVLYLHGGGYCLGSPATHRAITGRLALLGGARVFAAGYRLAPEHPFPAAVDDAVAAYRGLLTEGSLTGGIVVAGDSAGGGLSVATALRLRELGLPQPAALVLFSPWVDLGLGALEPPPDGEILITLPWIAECARFYLAGRKADEPLASPVVADLRGLPPTLIQVGTDELLLTDSRRLHAALAMAGVAVTLQEFPRRWHVFQVNAGLLTDADRALARAGEFIRSHAA